MDASPESAEVKIEGMRRRSNAADILEGAGVAVKHIYRAWTELESDVWIPHEGDRRRASIAIFLDDDDKPKTAMMVEDRIVIRSGWGSGPGPS